MAGSRHVRYFEIDYPALPGAAFDALCHDRACAAGADGYSVAANGMVIEQAQILTTHNLATLAGPLAVTPPGGWDAAARRTFVRRRSRFAIG